MIVLERQGDRLVAVPPPRALLDPATPNSYYANYWGEWHWATSDGNAVGCMLLDPKPEAKAFLKTCANASPLPDDPQTWLIRLKGTGPALEESHPCLPVYRIAGGLLYFSGSDAYRDAET